MHLTRSVVVLFAAILIAQTFGPIAHAAAGAPRAAAPPVAHPNINPANPTCNSGATPFSGGTGAFYSNQFESDYVTAPFSGAADVPNGHFKNVFLFNGGSSWDDHMTSVPLAQRAPTSEQIDAMTTAMVCSSYFDDLTQYNINPPTFDGDVATDPSCVTNAVNDAVSTGNVISYATMRSFAACIVNNAGDSTPQINIFVAPDLMASAFGQDTFGMCTPGITTAAYHGWGLSVPNFTVEPTNSAPKQACNNPGNILDSLSHEMVETLSDPGGFGWSHASGLAHADLGKQLNEGQLGDICSVVGTYPTPANTPGAIPFPDVSGMTGLSVAPYWSDQDNACEPRSIMNDTVLTNVSNNDPIISMSSTKHNLVLNVNQANPPTGPVDEWELDIETGPDNLNSSSAVNAIFNVTIGNQTVNLQENSINEGAEWATDSLHAVNLAIPRGLSISDVHKITLNTQFGGVFPDTWDIQGVVLQADIAPPNSCSVKPEILVNPDNEHATAQDDGFLALARMKGGAPVNFPLPVTAVPVGDKNRLVTGLQLTVSTTDHDDLRGGNHVTDNADALLTTAKGSVLFPNFNHDQELPSPSTTPQNLELTTLNTLPPGLTGADLTGFALQTNLPGGLSGDNWDVGSVTVVVSFGCVAGGPPSIATPTLLNAIGSSALADGSIGLCREQGNPGNHNCNQSWGLPAGLSASDTIDAVSVSIKTGQDSLEGGGFPESNVAVDLAGFPQTFKDVNAEQAWESGDTHTVFLTPMPSSPITLGAFNGINVKTSFGGGTGSDNWDIKDIKVDAVVTHLGAALRPLATAAPTKTISSASHVGNPAILMNTDSSAINPPPVTPFVTGPSPWHVVPTANTGAGDNVLNGVTCADPTHCFAVGYSSVNGAPQALIEASNGGATPFNAVPTPDTGEKYSALTSVSCISTTNCYAVGWDGSGSPEGDSDAGTKQVLIENWNGATWTITQSANPPGEVASELNSVSCNGGNLVNIQCIAVGDASTTVEGSAQTLTMRWLPATSWMVIGSPNADTGNNVLNGVSCSTPVQCAAVGYSDGSGFAETLTMTYNGSSWVIVPSGNAGQQGNVFDGMGNNYLYSVSCLSASDCVAVGGSVNSHRITNSLVETLGSGGPLGQSQFNPAPAPNPGQSGNLLFGVSCTTSIDCKAVGVDWNGDIDETLNINFDGTSWFTVPTPSPGPERNFLLGDECLNPGSCLAVGDFVSPANVKQTLALNFVGTVPDAPTNAVAVSGDQQAEISFTPPVNNGGFNIQGYTVTATDVKNPINGGQTGSATGSPVTVLGLTNGDKYTFTVTATTVIGTGPPSLPSKAITIKPAGVTKFTPMVLQNGWLTPAGGTTVGAAVKSGIVYLKGQMATPGANPVAFTLPPKMRPSTNVFVPVLLCGTNNGDIEITPAGIVQVAAEGGAFANAACGTSLDGASFVLKGATPLALQNVGTNSPFGTGAAGAVSKSGEVYLAGAIAGGAGQVAFTLPVKLRPAKPTYVPVDLCGSNNGDLFIDTTGIVTIRAEGGVFSNAVCMTSLDGVRYSLTAATPLTLLNGWTNGPFGTNAATALTKSGLVFLRGAIATAGANPNAFKLPVQMRPTTVRFIPIDLCNGANGGLRIQPDGVVQVSAENGVFSNAQCFTSLDGVFFDS
jgi:hypothetical protein